MAGKLAAGGSASKKPVSDKPAGQTTVNCHEADVSSGDNATIEASDGTRAGSRPSPRWLVDARNRLARLASLPQDWDREGGLPPQPPAIRSAHRVLEAVEACQEVPHVHIGPSSSGGLGLEWRHENRDLDLDIAPDGSIEYLKSTRAGSTFDMNDMVEGRLSPDETAEVHRLVGWLMNGS